MMRSEPGRFSISRAALGLALALLGVLFTGRMARGQGGGMTVTVGPADADIIGADNVAIQKAVDRVVAAGGGTVLIRPGTYLLANSVRLASHVRLQGSGPTKTLLKKVPGVESRLKLDADYGEMVATVESAAGLAPGMGITIVDKASPEGWTPSIRTIISIDGNTLHLDQFLRMDYSVEKEARVFNTFPLIAGFDVQDAQVEDLSVDGSRAGSGILDGCQTAGIYFFHSQRVAVRNCVARDYPGDGISLQFVEDPVVENCEADGNAYLGIHLGTGALRGIVRDCRAHDNGRDGFYLCWRVQQSRYERNQSWNNARYGMSLGHKDTDNTFTGNICAGNGRAGVYFRDESGANAASRNTFVGNTFEDNGRPGEPGYGVRIEGETRDVQFIGNTFRSRSVGGVSLQPVGIYIGPKTDSIRTERNLFLGGVQKAIVDESPAGQTRQVPSGGQQER